MWCIELIMDLKIIKIEGSSILKITNFKDKNVCFPNEFQEMSFSRDLLTFSRFLHLECSSFS